MQLDKILFRDNLLVEFKDTIFVVDYNYNLDTLLIKLSKDTGSIYFDFINKRVFNIINKIVFSYSFSKNVLRFEYTGEEIVFDYSVETCASEISKYVSKNAQKYNIYNMFSVKIKENNLLLEQNNKKILLRYDENKENVGILLLNNVLQDMLFDFYSFCNNLKEYDNAIACYKETKGTFYEMYEVTYYKNMQYIYNDTNDIIIKVSDIDILCYTNYYFNAIQKVIKRNKQLFDNNSIIVSLNNTDKTFTFSNIRTFAKVTYSTNENDKMYITYDFILCVISILNGENIEKIAIDSVMRLFLFPFLIYTDIKVNGIYLKKNKRTLIENIIEYSLKTNTIGKNIIGETVEEKIENNTNYIALDNVNRTLYNKSTNEIYVITKNDMCIINLNNLSFFI